MKKRHSVPLAILTAIGLSTAAAQATPIVVVSGGFASEVDDLDVDGTLYDVTFANAIDLTFQGNSSGALDAANGLSVALNGSTAVNVIGPAFSANGFTVADDSLGNGPTVGNPLANVGNWSVNVFGAGQPYAQFALVPEPASFALLGASLFGLGAIRRRSK